MREWLAVALLLVLAAFLHLWRLDTPRQVIFDEVYFGKFITAYCCTHERFFDIHPPHAKLLTSGTARLLGYRGGFPFDHIGQEYGSLSPLGLRLLPALTGIVLPLIFYAVLRQLKVSPLFSFLGGLTVALDNAMLVQTRIIALDGLLLAGTFGAVAAYLFAEKQSGSKAWWWYALAGALAGLAAGTKFTGLAAVALLGVLIIFNFSGFARSREARQFSIFKRLLPGLVIFLCAIVVYTAGWWLHFALLTQPGSGDAWGVPTGNFWQDTVKLHRTMLSANYNLTATHPDESSWWSWPLMLTSVFYWSGSQGEVMYFLGNPIVWWGGSILFLIAVFDAIRKRFSIFPTSPRLRGAGNFQFSKLWIPLVGFLIAMVPLVRVPRALFLYHYLTPLLFTLAFGLVWVDRSLRQPSLRRNVVLGAAVALVVLFVVFAPLSYGLTVSPAWLSVLYWLPGWR